MFILYFYMHGHACTFQAFHTLLQPGWLGHRSGLAIATAGGQTLCACEGSYESVPKPPMEVSSVFRLFSRSFFGDMGDDPIWAAFENNS